MSPPRPPDPRRLDLASFARSAGLLEGEWPLAGMPRLLQDALPPTTDSPTPGVAWSARGEMHRSAGGETQTRLLLRARTALRLTCQRCLQPVVVELEVAPTLRFVRDEAMAERLDEESEEDVLAMPPSLDLHALVEDELILALPLVPRHERCPEPLPMSAGELDEAGPQRAEGAFAGLAELLKDQRGKPG
jgi:uncharacterized protein